MKITGVIICLNLLLAGGALRAEEAIASVGLNGLDGQEGAITIAELRALPRVTLTVAQHGETHVYEGAQLGDVLARVGAPQGKAIHGADMMDVIIVEARDGYKIALDLAGTDASTRKDRVILADRMDNAPLDEKAGPFRLVVEGDLRPSRAVRMVSKIRVERLR